MSDNEIHAISTTAATNPAARLTVALAAVHAARPHTIRHLRLDDVDLPNRCVSLGGHPHRLDELTATAAHDWLLERHRRWPHTTNPHLIITRLSATTTSPVSADYLDRILRPATTRLARIRSDRILHESLHTKADPLHLATVFDLSERTAIAYAALARKLLADSPQPTTPFGPERPIDVEFPLKNRQSR